MTNIKKVYVDLENPFTLSEAKFHDDH